jgi:hypothetical protein
LPGIPGARFDPCRVKTIPLLEKIMLFLKTWEKAVAPHVRGLIVLEESHENAAQR